MKPGFCPERNWKVLVIRLAFAYRLSDQRRPSLSVHFYCGTPNTPLPAISVARNACTLSIPLVQPIESTLDQFTEQSRFGPARSPLDTRLRRFVALV